MINFERLKDIREDHDLSQQEMAKILNTNRATYSMWELGINIIPLKDLCNFADYFNLSIDYVLNLSNNKTIKLIKGLDLNVLGNNIKTLRNINNLTQRELADKLNISKTSIYKYEHGLTYITIPNLYNLSKLFNVSINKLCGKE